MANKTFYQKAVEEYGEETARKMWKHAVDPVTGYIAKDLNEVHLLDGKTPCVRCGGVGLWKPSGSDRDDEILCLKCHDEWGKACPKLLDKHGYVWSKKKWHAAFQEFCETKTRKIDIEKHNRVTKQEQELTSLLVSGIPYTED